MNRWQAITQIVRLFISANRPSYALVALALFAAPALVTGVAVYMYGPSAVTAVTKLNGSR